MTAADLHPPAAARLRQTREPPWRLRTICHKSVSRDALCGGVRVERTTDKSNAYQVTKAFNDPVNPTFETDTITPVTVRKSYNVSKTINFGSGQVIIDTPHKSIKGRTSE